MVNDRLIRHFDTSYFNPLQYSDILLYVTTMYKYLDHNKIWEDMGYTLCKAIKQEIELPTEVPSIGMLSGLGEKCFAVQLYCEATGNLTNFSNALFLHYLKNVERCSKKFLDSQQPLTISMYDCVSGISGALYYLLSASRNNPSPHLDNVIDSCITYLVHLTNSHEVNGKKYSNFTVMPDGFLHENEKYLFLNGYLNFGLSHGMLGPVVALTEAYTMGYRSEKVLNAIEEIYYIYDKYAHAIEGVYVWPSKLPVDLHLKSPDLQLYHLISSWCYGNVGIIRGMYKCACKMGKVKESERHLQSFVNIVDQSINKLNLSSPSLCHGLCSVISIQCQMWRDTKDPRVVRGIDKLASSAIEISIQNTQNCVTRVARKNVEGLMMDFSLLCGSLGIALSLVDALQLDNYYSKLLMID